MSELSAMERLDRVCDSFEAAWRTGERPRIEDYLADIPEPERSAGLRELIALEIAYRRQAGEDPRPEDYNSRFPSVDWTELYSTRQRRLDALTASSEVTPAQIERTPSPQGGLLAFLAPAQQPDEIGRLGPYRIVKLLGTGGMGMVLQAEDVQLHRWVALKVMRLEMAVIPESRQRFLREARTAAAVEHDHIVPIYQVGEDRGVPFLAMQLLRGESLDERLRREGPLPLADVIRIGREIAQGLAAAHERELIHRDIKPSNLWLHERPTWHGEAPRYQVKVLDFGLARSIAGESHLTQTGNVLGTPAYMSPEQAESLPVDARSDLFSLGSVLYHMVTGQPPFRGRSLLAVLRAVTDQHPASPCELRPEVPPVLSDLILQLLNKDRDRRPASARMVIETLQRLEGAGLAAQPVPPPSRVPETARAGVSRESTACVLSKA